MPTTDLISPFVVSCAGGLTLNKDVFSMQPGEALILQNFEPDIKGGYRRVSGTALYNSTIVPEGSSNSSLVVDCSIIFNGQIIVARGGDIHRGTTSGSWTSLTTGLGTSYIKHVSGGAQLSIPTPSPAQREESWRFSLFYQYGGWKRESERRAYEKKVQDSIPTPRSRRRQLNAAEDAFKNFVKEVETAGGWH